MLPLLAWVGSLRAGDVDIDEVASPAEAKPGKVCLVTAGDGGGMRYFLRVPRGYDPDEGARLVVFLHGSNMNGLQYLETIEGKRWCRGDILVCPNGEQGDDPFGANNFTFGSAPLVAGVVREVTQAYPATRCYVGGHSQGGFLTYSVILHHPELFDGAFPMAGGCWSQNEPNLWEEKPEILAEQRNLAIAVIHGRRDPLVDFSMAEHAHGVFLAMGYPKLRLLAPEELGHQFALSPVPEALEWLDAVTGLEPDDSMKAARDWFDDGEFGWALAAVQVAAQAGGAGSPEARRAQGAVDAIERKAEEAVRDMAEAMRDEEPAVWVPEWFEFQRVFGGTAAAAELVGEYDEARARERETGLQLFRTALGQRRGGDGEAMRQTLADLLGRAPHSYHAWYALHWAED